MADTLQRAFDRLRQLPEDRQQEAADLLEDFLSEGVAGDVYVLDEEERRLVAEGDLSIAKEGLATEDEFRAVLDKYRRR